MKEKEKSIEDMILVLTKVSDEFKKLHQEAKLALGKGNRGISCEKLSQKAGLLVELSSSLPSRVNGIEDREWYEVLDRVRLFARQAKEAYASGETFALGSLLMHPGDLNIEHNDLQKLVDEFKNEHVTSLPSK
ncbi:hypothetical protein AMJ47_01605 [Parcubacteria bacterium DG_72]|nr:MAG: hypothetical protein AMJ47_01605 [Parcubacteria bacterium DG_72]